MVSLLPVAIMTQYSGAAKNFKLRNDNSRNLSDMASRFVEHARGILLLKSFPENGYFREQLMQSAERFEQSGRAESKNGAWQIAKFFIPFEL
ncbi:MAG: hypothetical protein LBT05_17045 [Planctomycetaceae bacterium]|jgi:ABC-type transport system involved in cytochrome bd biosynthesis fused ATPase/permease subunit|nr:hypothetical protein [Planctomycetaceae bacterium]